MNPIRILPILLLLSLAACGADAPDARPGAATVRDSAGIRIVENTGGGRWTRGDGWKLSSEPRLQIGVAEGGASYQMDRVSMALRLSDGRIAVANDGSEEIRWYGADGRHVSSAGRKGGGPGEFRSVVALRRTAGDTVVADDRMLARLSWFDSAGRFVRSVQLQPGGDVPPRFVDRFADGTLLLFSTVRRPRTGPPPAGTRRDTLRFLRASADGAVVDSLALVPGSESSLIIERSGGDIVLLNAVTLPFMRNAHTVVMGNGYWQGLTEAYELVLRGADGTPQRIVRRAVEPVPVRGAYLDSLRRVQVARQGPAAAKALDGIEIPERLPFFERLLVDDESNLWVQRTAWPGNVQPEWDVFDADGALLGTVRMPAGFRAMHIGADFVLGVWKDEDDVEYVRMYGLEK